MIRLINIDYVDLYVWEFQYQLRRKTMTEDERIKEDLEMELHIKTENDKMINKIMKTIRERRDVLLARSDYYLSMPDIKITDEKKEDILKYRQELRDFPSKIVNGVYDDKIHVLVMGEDELLGCLPKL
jgi:restriction endonuclease S subunit